MLELIGITTTLAKLAAALIIMVAGLALTNRYPIKEQENGRET